MMNVFSVEAKLIPTLMLLLFSSLVLGKNTPQANYVKPGIDLASYTKVLVKPLNMDSVEILKPVWEQGDSNRWELEIEDLATIQKIFMEAMQKELESNSGYALVSESGVEALRIEVEILSITPYVKPGTADKRSNHRIKTLGSGSLVFSAELRDSKTRELLILVEGETSIGEQYREVSVENHTRNLADLFGKWGKRVRQALDENRGSLLSR